MGDELGARGAKCQGWQSPQPFLSQRQADEWCPDCRGAAAAARGNICPSQEAAHTQISVAEGSQRLHGEVSRNTSLVGRKGILEEGQKLRETQLVLTCHASSFQRDVCHRNLAKHNYFFFFSFYMYETVLSSRFRNE